MGNRKAPSSLPKGNKPASPPSPQHYSKKISDPQGANVWENIRELSKRKGERTITPIMNDEFIVTFLSLLGFEVHVAPSCQDGDKLPCCGKYLSEMGRLDLLTLEPGFVTCGGE